MDSGSGSIQSSSCGDEEYDSQPISSFLNVHRTAPSPSLPAFSQPFPDPPSFDAGIFSSPFSSSQLGGPSPACYLDNMFQTGDPLLNPDMTWLHRTPQPSDPNCTVGLTAPISPSPAPPTASTGGATHARGSKKRPRASRRAPTTVLTTDTSNFRQMVQEFTGVPAQPFSPPAFPRSRVDYFGSNVLRPAPTAASVRDPLFLLRPFAQKLPIPTFGSLASGSRTSASISSAAIATAPTSSGISTAPNPNMPATNPTAIISPVLRDRPSGVQLQPREPVPGSQINPLFALRSAPQSLPPSEPFNQRMPMMSIAGSVLRGPSETLTGNLSTLYASDGLSGSGAGGSGGGNPEQVWPDLRPPEMRSAAGSREPSTLPSPQQPVGKSAESGTSMRGSGTMNSWLCSSD